MQLARRRNGGTDRRWMVGLALLALSTAAAGRGQNPGQRSEEVVLQSGTFRLVGDLRLPAGPGPHPVVVFVHGDGSVYLGGEYFRNPMDVIERSPIPVLAFFGERDTQLDPVRGLRAFRAALSRAGNPKSTVVLIPGADHNMILSESGCITERQRRSVAGWRDYSPRYPDVLEEWLTTLRRRPPFTETELPPPFIRPIVKGARR